MHIIHIDEHVIILNKPAGLPVLPDGWEKDSEYLVKMLEEKYDKIFIVHRLDKITSGVMVFARDAETHRALNMQFEHHEAQKIYHAIVEGNPKWEEKITKFPLHANVGHKHRTIVDDTKRKTVRDQIQSFETVSIVGFGGGVADDGAHASDQSPCLGVGASAVGRCPVWRIRN